jgi:hypothetical protein
MKQTLLRRYFWAILVMFSGEGFASNFKAPVVIAMGGFNSCHSAKKTISMHGKSRFIKSASKLFAQLSSHSDQRTDRPQSIYTCFTKDGSLYLQHSKSRKLYRGTVRDVAAIEGLLKSLSENYSRPVIISGHSHGAWLALKVLVQVKTVIPKIRLVTIDPISFSQCNIATYASIMRGGGSLAPCQRAPTDIAEAEFKKVRNVLGQNRWINYYQRNFLPLRSGPFDSAYGPNEQFDLSPFMKFFTSGSVMRSWNAHGAIQEIGVIWYSMKSIIENDQY